MATNLTILIPAYNEQELIETSVTAVARQQGIHDLTVKAVILANGCTDNTHEASRAAIQNATQINPLIPWELVILEEGHKSKALNYGIARADSDLILYSDADCRLGDTAAMAIYEDFVTHPERVVVGVLDEPDFTGRDKEEFLYQCQRVNQIRREERGRVLTVGSCVALDRSRMTPIPTNIHSEDTWVSLRAAQLHGWESVKILNNAVVYFQPTRNWTEYIQQETRFDNGFLQLMHSHPDLKAVYDARRSMDRSKRNWEEIDARILARMALEGIPAEVFSYSRNVLDRIIEENSDMLWGRLIDGQGKWATIPTTKSAIK